MEKEIVLRRFLCKWCVFYSLYADDIHKACIANAYTEKEFHPVYNYSYKVFGKESCEIKNKDGYCNQYKPTLMDKVTLDLRKAFFRSPIRTLLASVKEFFSRRKK